MEVEVTSRSERAQMDREEVNAVITFSGATPSRLKVREALAKETGADEELTVVRQVKPVFGSTKANVTARIYTSKDSLESIEGSYMKDRHSASDEAPAEEPDEEGGEDAEETEPSEEDADEAEEEPEEDEGAEEADDSEESEEDKE